MNYGSMPGQNVRAPQNPASGAPSSDPFNFIPTAVGTGGTGSNQFQQMPSWLNNTTNAGGGGPVSTAPRPVGGPAPPNYSAGYGGYAYGGTPTPSGGSTYGGPMGSANASPGGGGLSVPTQSAGPYNTQFPGLGWMGVGGGPFLGSGGGSYTAEQPVDPALTGDLSSYLKSQIGQGVSPFNLSTALPFGGTTQPGQLNAPANQILQQLMGMYSGQGTSMPGGNTLSTIANQGISALPEWQAMVNAMGQNTAQNQANLQEQFASMGDLAGSPFGTAMSNFQQGVNQQQNALLGQLQQQNILQGQIPVAEGLLSGGQQFGQYAQGLSQQNIQNMLNEYIRTSPQNNPLLGLQYGMSTTYDPALQNPPKGGGVLGALAGAAPGIISTLLPLFGI